MQGLQAATTGCLTRSSANTVIISVGSAHGPFPCFNVILITCSKRSDAALCDICNYKVLYKMSTPLRSATTFGSAVGNSFSSSPSGCCQLKESSKLCILNKMSSPKSRGGKSSQVFVHTKWSRALWFTCALSLH